MPRPAAIPAMGPSQRDMPLLAAAPAAPAAAAGAAARCAVLPAAVGGVTAWRCWVTLVDWRPKLLPPPMRRASASNDAVSNAPVDTTSVTMAKNRENRVMHVLRAPRLIPGVVIVLLFYRKKMRTIILQKAERNSK